MIDCSLFILQYSEHFRPNILNLIIIHAFLTKNSDFAHKLSYNETIKLMWSEIE